MGAGLASQGMHPHAHIVHPMLTQHSLMSDLKKFQKKGEWAVSKELLQLHMRYTFKGALESLMSLKKRDGTLNGQTCDDGRKQREAARSGDATSPTVSLESVLITAAIDAFEGRDEAVFNVPGAFLSTGMDEEVIMTLHGRVAELMAKTAPDIYWTYITMDSNNKSVLYVKLQNALHGRIRSALLFEGFQRTRQQLVLSGTKIK
jgi:hypothetical protein